jgi:uridine kinase
MIGDVIGVKPAYLETGKRILDVLPDGFFKQRRIIQIAGESGSGKSVTAVSLQRLLVEQGIDAYILHQDDYFHLPPASNHQKRMDDLLWVGPQEVKLDVLNLHQEAFKQGETRLEKPLVDYHENQILSEVVRLDAYRVLLVEGTYVFAAGDADLRIFMNRTYLQTRKNREERARETQSEFLEKVLAIEHHIIQQQRTKAHLLVLDDYSVQTLHFPL